MCSSNDCTWKTVTYLFMHHGIGQGGGQQDRKRSSVAGLCADRRRGCLNLEQREDEQKYTYQISTVSKNVSPVAAQGSTVWFF